jgi:single-stranded-DNA-specific exonuclease
MLKPKTRWQVKAGNEIIANELAKSLGIAPLVAMLLVNRGIDTIEKAKTFLYTEQQPFHDPFLLDGMDQAVKRIEHAIKQKEKILVFGDYDADGVSSTTVLLTALREKGAIADFYIPNRFTEGYGPNEAAFRSAKEEGYTLIITVDTGIAAIHEAAVAEQLGIDLIITDHHEPGPVLPNAFAIIHPKKEGSTYPFQYLAGVGVAFKLAHAILGKVPEHLLEIAAIGTIADLVPLIGENRLIAKRGIQKLQTTKRPGITALLKVCGVNQSEINEDTIGFAIAPRINAVGRLESADPAVHLLMTEDPDEAMQLAQEVDALNKERQQLVNEITVEAIKEVEEKYPPEKYPVLVVAKENWNAGVIGIVASRLVEKYYRPTIVLSIDREKGLAKGSARSIVGFDLFANLSKCRDILPHFGGHPMAAGMTLSVEDIEELRNRLVQQANEILTEEDFIPVTTVDTVCTLSDVTIEAIEQLAMLAPFGVENPRPVFQINDVNVANMRKIGAEQNHLKTLFEQDGHSLDGIGFGLGHLGDEISPFAKISVIGELSINEWNNFRKPQLFIQDLSVNEWQLFDLRGIKNIQGVIEAIPESLRQLIVFNRETIETLHLHPYLPWIQIIDDEQAAEAMDVQRKFMVLIDMPPSEQILRKLLLPNFPDRIYAWFHYEQNHFFSTLPTREHFKWFYAFLAKKGPFDLKRYAEDLAKYRGWTKETIDFMSQVFFELDFVKIDKGFISLSPIAAKRDLKESPTYQRKQQQIQLEKQFLYSSFKEMKQWFDALASQREISDHRFVWK